MKTINTLSQDLISKIAAGEVVERPASVVKELVENTLDAGATHVTIKLEDAGLKSIKITDDGKGMSAEDILVCFLPHTTSKISGHEDLLKISSFGFRGEALWSIAAVSNMIIKSRERTSESGTVVELVEGSVIETKSIGMPIGTEITVESLFNSTPARRKFLKNQNAELRYITDLVTQFTLAFPAIRFTLVNNNNILLDAHAESDLKNRVSNILGKNISEQVIPVEHDTRYGKISGFIGKPQLASSSKNHQYIFVNNRNVNHFPLSKAVAETYGSLIEPRTYPVFVLYFTLPYENVDVNVHPRKEEVAFAYPKELLNLTKEAVQASLTKHNLTYSENAANQDMDQNIASMLRDIVNPWNVKDLQEQEILQIHNLYLLAPTKNGMLLVDQHAAHERILFEQYKEALENVRSTEEKVLLPEAELFELSVSDALLLEENLETLQTLGFDIEAFGNRTFRLTAVPESFKARDYGDLIRALLEDLKSGDRVKIIDRTAERTLSYLACRNAIKAGDALTQDERKRLLEKLLQLTTSYTCPHGRPTHIEVSLSYLDKMFKRR